MYRAGVLVKDCFLLTANNTRRVDFIVINKKEPCMHLSYRGISQGLFSLDFTRCGTLTLLILSG